MVTTFNDHGERPSQHARADSMLRPPWFVRLERWLHLPVPVAWRPWVAEIILSEEWTRRHEARYRWSRAHRIQLIVAVGIFELTIFAGVVLATGSFAGITGLVVAPLMFVATNRSRNLDIDEVTTLVRTNTRRWNGLQPDGVLDHEPDRLLTLAALPAWAIALIAAAEIVTVAGVIALPVVLLSVS